MEVKEIRGKDESGDREEGIYATFFKEIEERRKRTIRERKG